MSTQYDFNAPIDRENTRALKYELREKLFGRKDVIPMWVADMEFRPPQEVVDMVARRAAHGVFGYTIQAEDFTGAVAHWMREQHNWEINPERVTYMPGVVPALAMAVQAYSKAGDGILVQRPVYHPFFDAVQENGRKLVNNALVKTGDRYEIDFEDFEAKAKLSRVFLLSNPHNPVGRVWTRAELERMVEICLRYDVMIMSDEIHADLVWEGHQHIPTATLSEEAANITVTFNAASKTFNIAGFAASYVIFNQQKHMAQYEKVLAPNHLNFGNLFGTEGTIAAYAYGQTWLYELRVHLQKNIAYVIERVHEATRVRIVKPEATYLLWLDFSALELSHREIEKKLIQQAGLGLNDGCIFGVEGRMHFRMNVACQHPALVKAIDAFCSTFKGL